MRKRENDQDRQDDQKKPDERKPRDRLSFEFRKNGLGFHADGTFAILAGLTGLAMVLIVIMTRLH